MVEGPQPGFGEADTREVHTYTVERPEGTLGFFVYTFFIVFDSPNLGKLYSQNMSQE
jgi:hypothetical protein